MTEHQNPIQPDHPKRLPTLTRLRDTDETVAPSEIDIRGRLLKDTDGHDVGKIDALLIDDIDRKVRFMEVASGGFIGLGASRTFIPIDAIARIEDQAVYITHTGEHVAGAPRYDPDLAQSDVDSFFGLYPHYGLEGYAAPAPWVTSWPTNKGIGRG